MSGHSVPFPLYNLFVFTAFFGLNGVAVSSLVGLYDLVLVSVVSDLVLHDNWWANVLDLDDICVATAPVDQLEKDRPQVSIWSLFQLSPVRDTFRHILRINRNLNVGLFVDGSPKLGS